MKHLATSILALVLLSTGIAAADQPDKGLHADVLATYTGQTDSATIKQFNSLTEESLELTQTLGSHLSINGSVGLGQLNGNTSPFAPSSFNYTTYSAGLSVDVTPSTTISASYGQVGENNGITYRLDPRAYHQVSVGLKHKLF